MHLIVGLGNPGSSYAGHRHNVGFMAIDVIADHYVSSGFSKKFNGELAEISVEGEKTLLLKPQTFMNKSGLSVGAAMRFYKIQPSDVTVLHDELDLPLAKLRVKTGGGHGGHNGLRDIDAHIGKDYQRVRIGIDHPGHKDRVTGHVLSPFSGEQRQDIDRLLEKLADHVPLIVKGEESLLMTKMAA